MLTLVVVGGSKAAVERLRATCPDVQVVFHEARVKSKHARRELEHAVRDADYVVIMVEACSHQGMWDARAVAKRYGAPVHYNRGLGVSTINTAMRETALA